MLGRVHSVGAADRKVDAGREETTRATGVPANVTADAAEWTRVASVGAAPSALQLAAPRPRERRPASETPATSLTGEQVLMAHPGIRETVALRLRAMEWGVARDRDQGRPDGDGPAVAAILTRLTTARDALDGARYAELLAQLEVLRQEVGSFSGARSGQDRFAMTRGLRVHLAAIDNDLRYPNRAAADVPTRYAQYMREYAALEGRSATTHTDPAFWGSLQNAGLAFLFEHYPLEGGRTAMEHLDAQNPLPTQLVADFEALRRGAVDGPSLVRGAAQLVHAYSRSTEGRARNIVCRDASELMRKLMTGADLPVRVETFVQPFGHAYNVVTVGGRELFVDSFFHPGGPIVMDLAQVQARGFGSPSTTRAPAP